MVAVLLIQIIYYSFIIFGNIKNLHQAQLGMFTYALAWHGQQFQLHDFLIMFSIFVYTQVTPG